MSDEQSIEEEIARAIGGVLFNVSNFPEKAQSRLWGQDMKPLNDKLTSALSPILNRVRAEALREAADHLEATTELLNPNHGSELAYINCTRIDARELRELAGNIEQNSEGNET